MFLVIKGFISCLKKLQLRRNNTRGITRNTVILIRCLLEVKWSAFLAKGLGVK